MQNWNDLYIEIAKKITEEIQEVRWVDLWHNQIGFLKEEAAFPSPAVFLDFRIINAKDIGQKIQELDLQVSMRVFYETYAETHLGNFNQGKSMSFLKITNDLHKQFHATSGKNYSSMRRVGFNSLDTDSAHNLYLINFTCKVMDSSAEDKIEKGKIGGLDLGDVTFKL